MKNKILKSLLFVIVAVLAGVAIVHAGSLTPPGSASATMYTLDDIFTKLTINSDAGSHSLSTSTSPAATFHTLSQIYDAIPTIDPAKLLMGTTYLGVAGTIPFGVNISGANASTTLNIPLGYYSGTTTVTASDTNLISSNILNNVSIFGVAGTIPVQTGEVVSVSSATSTNKLILTVPMGYYDGTTTLSTTSDNFIAANIRSGTDIFGLTGNMAAGYTYGDSDPSKVLTTAAGAGTYVGINYSLWNLQTKDDWVNSEGTVGEYTAEEGPWTAVSGSPFSGFDAINFSGSNNLKSGIVYQDGRTGLWWSDLMAIGSTASTTDNLFTVTADGTRPTGGSAIRFCDALNTANFAGHNDWYLPTQKQLMQAYIDGSANNLPNTGYSLWSSTESSSASTNAWRFSLYFGNVFNSTKTTMSSVRCVR